MTFTYFRMGITNTTEQGNCQSRYDFFANEIVKGLWKTLLTVNHFERLSAVRHSKCRCSADPLRPNVIDARLPQKSFWYKMFQLETPPRFERLSLLCGTWNVLWLRKVVVENLHSIFGFLGLNEYRELASLVIREFSKRKKFKVEKNQN